MGRNRTPATSVDTALHRHTQAGKQVEPPADFDLSEEEAELFQQYAHSRDLDRLRHSDLRVIARLAQTEIRLKTQQAIFDNEGPVLEQPDGRVIKNPRLQYLNQLTSALNDGLRQAGLTVRRADAEHDAGRATPVSKPDNGRDDDVLSLLAS